MQHTKHYFHISHKAPPTLSCTFPVHVLMYLPTSYCTSHPTRSFVIHAIVLIYLSNSFFWDSRSCSKFLSTSLFVSFFCDSWPFLDVPKNNLNLLPSPISHTYPPCPLLWLILLIYHVVIVEQRNHYWLYQPTNPKQHEDIIIKVI